MNRRQFLKSVASFCAILPFMQEEKQKITRRALDDGFTLADLKPPRYCHVIDRRPIKEIIKEMPKADEDIFKELLELHDKGFISTQSFAEEMKIDYDEEVKRMRGEISAC